MIVIFCISIFPGLEDPRWGGTLIRLPRPRDRRPLSPRPRRNKKKTGKKGKGKRGGKKSSSKKDYGRPPRRSKNKKANKKTKGNFGYILLSKLPGAHY